MELELVIFFACVGTPRRSLIAILIHPRHHPPKYFCAFYIHLHFIVGNGMGKLQSEWMSEKASQTFSILHYSLTFALISLVVWIYSQSYSVGALFFTTPHSLRPHNFSLSSLECTEISVTKYLWWWIVEKGCVGLGKLVTWWTFDCSVSWNFLCAIDAEKKH